MHFCQIIRFITKFGTLTKNLFFLFLFSHKISGKISQKTENSKNEAFFSRWEYLQQNHFMIYYSQEKQFFSIFFKASQKKLKEGKKSNEKEKIYTD